MCNTVSKLIKGQDAKYKDTNTISKETSICITNEMYEFIGGNDGEIAFRIFKSEFLHALGCITSMAERGLYFFNNGREEKVSFSSDWFQTNYDCIQLKFGQNEIAEVIYTITDRSNSGTNNKACYIYKGQESFFVRDFLIKGHSILSFCKNNDVLELHITTNPTLEEYNQVKAQERREAFYHYLQSVLEDKTSAPRYLKGIQRDVVVDAVKATTEDAYDDIFQIDDSSIASAIREAVIADRRNNDRTLPGNYGGFPGSACTHYVSFLDSVNNSNPDDDDNESALQTIYYGAPGTGKSYKIKHDIIPESVTPYRVTFYPDYYYSDFVGGLRPRNGENGIEYKFEAGPFAKALKDAFKEKVVYMIIEEINRGNAAAIFGDLFQLLDRKNGRSEYSITNHDLYQYLVDEGVIGLEENQVYIPSNLNILCTMNTADQNVFVLDTAFKRRFRMEYVPIDFNSYYIDGKEENGVKDSCNGYLDNTTIFEGEEDDLKVIMGEDIYTRVKNTIPSPSRNWPTFAAYINAKIDTINAVEQKISEDKKLGPFFVDVDELTDRKAFADKVLYYLKQDVFKYEDNILEDSYENLYDDFVKRAKDIFLIFEPLK